MVSEVATDQKNWDRFSPLHFLGGCHCPCLISHCEYSLIKSGKWAPFVWLKVKTHPWSTNSHQNGFWETHVNPTHKSDQGGQVNGIVFWGWESNSLLHYCTIKDLLGLPHSFIQNRLMATTDVIITKRSLNTSLVCSAARPSKPEPESLEYSHQRQPMHHLSLPVHRQVCVVLTLNVTCS